MYKVYLDTNVILEQALQRKNYLEVVEIFHLSEMGEIECYTFAATFFTIAFFLRNESNSKQIFKTYFSFIKVVGMSEDDLQSGIDSYLGSAEKVKSALATSRQNAAVLLHSKLQARK